VDAGQQVNVVIDRLTTGPGVTHSINAFTTTAAATLNVSAGANVTSGIAGLTLGIATLGGDGTFSVGANALVTVTGAIGGGTSGLTKTGAGTLLLNGVNAYTGATTITAGAIGGNGSIAGNVSNGGFVKPGASPGLLTTSGNYAQTAAGAFEVELNGTTPGTLYDRLAVIGTVTLAGQLSTNLNFTAATGDTFTIIDNAGSDAVVGTFAGLPEGATIATGGRLLRISYIGGDSNDVTLTVLPPPAVTGVFRFRQHLDQQFPELPRHQRARRRDIRIPPRRGIADG
jgi:autotransporter-associated beta strand protein